MMKTRIAIVSALLLGIVLGAVGTRALCDAGHCGIDSNETGEVPATDTAAIFGAGTTGAEPTSTPTADASKPTIVSEDAAVTPVTPTAEATRAIAQITGLAIIGDSIVDEYHADNPRGGEYAAVTFNWAELLAGRNRVNLGSWEDGRPEPRRGGYEFNWARSGATSTTMIEEGQHTGVAEQVRAGQVSHVIIQIGINDFYWDDVAIRIYEGQLTGEPLTEFLNGIVANIELAVGTVKDAGTDNIILSATPNFLALDVLGDADVVLPDETKRQRVIDALDYVNQGLAEVASREQVPFFDFNAALSDELDRRYDPTDRRYIVVGGERVEVKVKGDEPHHLFVGDEYAHPGTIFSGLIANLFIKEMNATFGTGIAPFSDDELLSIAGIRETARVERGLVKVQ